MPVSAVDQRQHLAFALAMQRAVAPDPSATACWSPFSVASALGLTASGARGATRAELIELLGADSAALLAPAARLDDEAVFGVTNTLWARENIAIRAEFADELYAQWPGGAIRDAPFATDPDGARQLINADVADTTHDLIPRLLAPGDITAGTVAALVNALYLKTAWRNAFPERDTRPRAFDGAGDVPTMRLSKRVGYAAAHGWQAVFLPARGGVEGVALLPDAPLTEAEPALTAPALADLLGRRALRQVELYLPKFRVRARADLTAPLAVLGVHTVFRRRRRPQRDRRRTHPGQQGAARGRAHHRRTGPGRRGGHRGRHAHDGHGAGRNSRSWSASTGRSCSWSGTPKPARSTSWLGLFDLGELVRIDDVVDRGQTSVMDS